MFTLDGSFDRSKTNAAIEMQTQTYLQKQKWAISFEVK